MAYQLIPIMQRFLMSSASDRVLVWTGQGQAYYCLHALRHIISVHEFPVPMNLI